MKLLWGIETMNKNYSERVAKWDNAKFLLILLVVIGHFVDLYTKNSASAKSLFLFIYFICQRLFFWRAYLANGLCEKNDMTKYWDILCCSLL